MSSGTRDEDSVGYDSRSDILLQALMTDLDQDSMGKTNLSREIKAFTCKIGEERKEAGACW